MRIKKNKIIQLLGNLISLRDERFWVIIATAVLIFSSAWLTYTERLIQEDYTYHDAELHELELMPNTEIRQQVNIKGNIKDLQIGINTPNTNRQASLYLRLVQGEYKELQYLNFEERGGKIWLPVNTENLSPGKFDICLVTTDEFSHNILTSNEYFGFASGLTENLALKLTTQIVPFHTKVRIVCLFLNLILFTLLIVTLNGKIEKSFMLYAIAFGMILLNIMIRFPKLSWQAEPTWETTSNLIWQTYVRGWKGSVLLDDAGYWCFFPRLLSIITLTFFGVVRSAFILQMFSAFLFSAVCAKFVDKAFDHYYSIEIRFLISLFLGCSMYLSFNELFLFHNIGYIGGMYLILCFMQNLEKIGHLRYIGVCILSVLICMSKFHYVVLLPIVMVALVGYKKYGKRLRGYLLICQIGPALMIFYYMLGIAESKIISPVKEKLSTIVLTVWYHFEQAILYFFKDYDKNGYWGGMIYNLVILIFLIYALSLVFKEKGKRKWLCLALGVWVIGILCTNTTAGRVTKMIRSMTDFYEATSYPSSRNEILVLIGIFFLFVIFMSDGFIIKTKSKQKSLIIIVMLLALIFRFSLSPNSSLNTYVEANWNEFSQYLDRQSYAIPGGPGNGYFLVKNADVTYFGNKKIEKINAHFQVGVSKVNEIDNTIQAINQIKLDGRKLIAVYSNKFRISQLDGIDMIVADSVGNVLSIVPGVVDPDRVVIGFFLEQPLEGAEKIYFIHSDTKLPFYMSSHLFVVTENLQRGVVGDANWGQSSLTD